MPAADSAAAGKTSQIDLLGKLQGKNLRWRDITTAVDREQRKLVVLHVRGKDKERKLVAPEKVGE